MNQEICPARLAAQQYGNSPAIVTDGIEISFRELDRFVEGASNRLESLRLDRGDRVPVLAANSPELVIFVLAALRNGLVCCPLPLRTPPTSLSGLIDQVGAQALVTDEARAAVPASVPKALLEDVCETTAPSGNLLFRDFHSGACAVFTSGSEGRPKAALLSYENLYFSAVGSNRNISIREGTRWLLSLPMYHVGGLGIIFRCLLGGGAVVIASATTDLEEAITRFRLTHVSLVSTQLWRALRERAPLDKLECVLVGGGPTPRHLLEQSAALGHPVRTTYGLTEMASQVTTSVPVESEDLTSSGAVLPFRSVRIGPGGEILVRGETLFQGYLDGGVLRKAVDENGWFHTGDLGFFDRNFRLHVRGRRDRRFVSGGENIDPLEVERAIEAVEGVFRAAIVDVPDDEFGARPVAFIEFEEEPIGDDELRRQLSEVLPRFKVPIAFFDWPERRRKNAKISRQELTEIALRKLRV